MEAPHNSPRENRTITVDFKTEATYFALLETGKAFVDFVMAFILCIGFQLRHKSECGGGSALTRHSHYTRARLGGVTIWRIQCVRCKAVFTVLPHFVLRYRKMHTDVAEKALIETHGGLSLEWSAVLLRNNAGVIAVDRPVTRPPPLGSRRAVFPHRALQ